MNNYQLYAMQYNTLIDEYEQFVHELECKSSVSLIKKKFPDLKENDVQTLEFKHTNKKIKCSLTENVLTIISYQGDIELKEWMIVGFNNIK